MYRRLLRQAKHSDQPTTNTNSPFTLYPQSYMSMPWIVNPLNSSQKSVWDESAALFGVAEG